MDEERLDEERLEDDPPEEEKPRVPWWVYGLMLLFLAVVVWLVDAILYLVLPKR